MSYQLCKLYSVITSISFTSQQILVTLISIIKDASFISLFKGWEGEVKEKVMEKYFLTDVIKLIFLRKEKNF